MMRILKNSIYVECFIKMRPVLLLYFAILLFVYLPRPSCTRSLRDFCLVILGINRTVHCLLNFVPLDPKPSFIVLWYLILMFCFNTYKVTIWMKKFANWENPLWAQSVQFPYAYASLTSKNFFSAVCLRSFMHPW